MENNTLQHWGILGMKWGVRRYQNKDGSLTNAGKKRLSRKQLKQRAKNLEKARDARAKKKIEEEEKRKLVEKGTADEVLKYKGSFTQDEMNKINSRLNWERNIKELKKKDQVDVKEKVDKMVDGVNTGIKAYNTVANILNAFRTSAIELPKIETNNTSGNRKERMEAKKKEKDDKKKAERQKWIESASRDEIMNNFGKMTIDELKLASNRATNESNIESKWKLSGSSNDNSSPSEPPPSGSPKPSSSSRKTYKFSKNTTDSSDEILTGTVEGEGKSHVNKSKFDKTNVVDIDYEAVDEGKQYALAVLNNTTELSRR